MTAKDALDLIQQGGALAAAVLALWALVTRRIITRGEFDRLDQRVQNQEKLNETAVEELRKQSATNARLVELSFAQRNEAERIRQRQVTHDDEADDRANR